MKSFSSISSGKKACAIASLITPSFTPTLKSSIIVLAINLASLVFAEVNNSVTYCIFLETVPAPSSSESFLILSNTFCTVSFVWNSEVCLDLPISFSTTIPKSPSFAHSFSIFETGSPVEELIAFSTNLEDIPVFLSSHFGKTFPCNK